MKILFYNHTGKVSGAERVLLMIVARLDRSRFEPVVWCPTDGPLMDLLKSFGIQAVPIAPLSARFTWRPVQLLKYLASFVAMIRAARAAVRAESPEIVHANSIRAGLVMTAATVGMRNRVVWHVHDLLPHHPLSSAIRTMVFALPRTEIVAVSHAVADRFRGVLLSRFPRRVRITVIHNAVDLDLFQPNHLKRSETRRQLGFSGQDLIVGTVGQLTPRKGQLELIEAFAKIAPYFPAAKLVIVGEALFNRDFEYAEGLKQAVDRLRIVNRVFFLGQREDVPDVTRTLDVAVVNSRAEPFGLTVVEAMAAGTPVLATAVDGIREIVDHHETGWLVTSGDALVDGLRSLLADSNLRTELSSKALSSVRTSFAADRFTADFQNFYRSLATASALHDPGQKFALEVKLSAD